jgi:hypothetical protein
MCDVERVHVDCIPHINPSGMVCPKCMKIHPEVEYNRRYPHKRVLSEGKIALENESYEEFNDV